MGLTSLCRSALSRGGLRGRLARSTLRGGCRTSRGCRCRRAGRARTCCLSRLLSRSGLTGVLRRLPLSGLALTRLSLTRLLLAGRPLTGLTLTRLALPGRTLTRLTLPGRTATRTTLLRGLTRPAGTALGGLLTRPRLLTAGLLPLIGRVEQRVRGRCRTCSGAQSRGLLAVSHRLLLRAGLLR